MFIKKINDNWNLFNPWQTVNDLHKEFSTIFDTVNDNIQRYRTGYPRFSLDESSDEITVKVFLPGYQLEDIDVQVVSDFLTIAARRELEEISGDEKVIHKERASGSFEETFNLPAKVKCDEVNAKYVNGILCITLPKLAEEKATSIKIV